MVMKRIWRLNNHIDRMKEKVEGDLEEMNIETFKQSLKAIRKKGGSSYEFLTKAGPGLVDALRKLFQTVWRHERKPDIWCETTLLQLYKGKGPRNNLDNQRHNQIKEDIPKLFGHVVMSEAKEVMISNMTKF